MPRLLEMKALRYNYHGARMHQDVGLPIQVQLVPALHVISDQSCHDGVISNQRWETNTKYRHRSVDYRRISNAQQL